MTDRLEEIKTMRAYFPKSLDASMIWWARNINWLIVEVEWLRERNIFVEESFEQVRRDWRSACDEIDERDKTITTLRKALDGPIRSIAYDVKQGGILGEMLLEEIDKALAATEVPQ